MSYPTLAAPTHLQARDRVVTPQSLTELDLTPYTAQTTFAITPGTAIISTNDSRSAFDALTEAVLVVRRILALPLTRHHLCFALRQSGEEEDGQLMPSTDIGHDHLMLRGLDEWYQGSNMVLEVFVPQNESEDLINGFVYRARPRTLTVNMSLVQAAAAARTSVGPTDDAYYRSLLYLVATIVHEYVHSMRRLIGEIKQIVVQTYEPEDECWFQVPSHTIRRLLEADEGWEQLLPFKPDAPDQVFAGTARLIRPHPRDGFVDTSNRSSRLGDQGRRCGTGQPGFQNTKAGGAAP